MAKWKRTRAFQSSAAGEQGRYKYRSWLNQNQNNNFCAYCFYYQDYADVEHYEPKAYCDSINKNPDLTTNLLLACKDCNILKLDYHPKFTNRKKGRELNTKVLNPFNEDLAKWYSIESKKLVINSSLRRKRRALENITLFCLDDRPALAERRESIFFVVQIFKEKLSLVSAEELIQNPDFHGPLKIVLKNYKLFGTFNISLSSQVERLLELARTTILD